MVRFTTTLIGMTLGAACLSACSESSRQETEEAGNAIAVDAGNVADRLANAGEDALDRASNRMDAAANRAEESAEKARRATGRAVENAGEALQR